MAIAPNAPTQQPSINPATVVALRQRWRSQLEQNRVIAVIRTDHWQTGVKALLAAARGGMRLLEITWNSDRPDLIISSLRQRVPNCTIGVGTLRSPQDAQRAIAAGAQFCFMPHVSPGIIATAIAHNCPVIPGALSPTEIINAWELGASAVKIFPAGNVGGSAYIKSISPVLPDIPLVPSGGVTLENSADFIEAGAIAVGLARQLFPKDVIKTQDWDTVTKKARTLTNALANQT
ncbi:MAG: bifunctional 4-hydroxy-2-oxoglutarate aldolase/2-dehydro-3-deoxy-phosphogluconate aldolase [Cyanobacteria bacterium P01_D01_bin.73]